jgi:hypothetical protein
VAFATTSKFTAALGNDKDSAMPATEASAIADTNPGKPQMAAKDRNATAIAQITMAFTTEATMTFVYEGMMNSDWPSGLAPHLVVRAIKEKHVPDDMISKVELRHQLNIVSMKKGDDHVVLFNQIASIKIKHDKPGQGIDETEFITVVTTQTPI